ncbi:MAG: Nif3-like dinuclear metal center hexameric protein, partial [Planctomycetota bacterium]
GCEALLTGEARFHSCLEAEAANIALILPGHFATERPAMEQLANVLHARFAELVVQASRNEYDPVKFC